MNANKTNNSFFVARLAMMLMMSALTTVNAWSQIETPALFLETPYITDIMVIGGSRDDIDSLKEIYLPQGWQFIDYDLNKGLKDADWVYLLYKADQNSDNLNHDYITDIYLQNKSAERTIPDFMHDNRRYYLAPYNGSSHFRGQKGCLNSGTGSSTDPIHIYYTKETFPDGRAISEISFDSNSSNAVGKEGNTSSGYDLNSNCGSSAAHIYMHAKTGKLAVSSEFVSDLMLIGAPTKAEIQALQSKYTSMGWKLIDYDLNKGIPEGKGDWIYLLYKSEMSDGYNYGYVTGLYLDNHSAAKTKDTIWNGSFADYYCLVPYDGSDHFKSQKGDLNSGTGDSTDPIHLYYTKIRKSDGQTIAGITFNNVEKNGLPKENYSYPYSLNAGTSGADIYLHADIKTSAIRSHYEGTGTAGDPVVINSENDWNRIADYIKYGRGLTQCYRLNSDITVSTMWGTATYPFDGCFDGGDHTLTVNIESDEKGAAPFHYIKSATIKNLNVAGSVKSTDYHAGGLVGFCSANAVSTIENCLVSTDVTGTGYAGGIVGHGSSGNLSVLSCIYCGTIKGFDKYAGGLVGWCDAITLQMTNDLFRGTFQPSNQGTYHPVVCFSAPNKADADISDAFYLNSSEPTAPDTYTKKNSGSSVSPTPVDGKWDLRYVVFDGQTYYVKCKTLTSYPYEYGFDGILADDGWKAIGDSCGVNSDDCFQFVSSSTDQYLISPLFDIKKPDGSDNEKPVITVQIKSRCLSTPVSFNVGYSTTTRDLPAFKWKQTLISESTSWDDLICAFSSDVKYVAIEYPKENVGSMQINDISIYENITDRVDYLVANDITSNSAQLGWSGPFDSYKLYVLKYPDFFDSFEDGDSLWTIVNQGGNALTGWRRCEPESWLNAPVKASTGYYSMVAGSYDPYTDKSYSVDNWLISPRTVLGSKLFFSVVDDGSHFEHYEVWVSTTTKDLSSFVKVAEPSHTGEAYEWSCKVVDLSSYQGKSGYFAFRLVDNGKNFIAIDDILMIEDYREYLTTDDYFKVENLEPSMNYLFGVAKGDGDIMDLWPHQMAVFKTLDGITPVESVSFIPAEEEDVWYDITGRKLEGAPVDGGLYLHNGQKVLLW